MTIPQQGSISLDSLPVGCVEEGVSVGAPCARERRRWWGAAWISDERATCG